MSRGPASLSIALALTALTGVPAQADWRDFMGRTMIAEVKTSGRTVTNVITARGGATTTDDVSTSDCDMTYRLYLSGKGRLFMWISRMDCAGMDPYVPDEASGTIIDLTVADGKVDAGPDSPQTPYTVRVEANELLIEQPQTDYVWNGKGYVTTFSNAAGSYVMRLRLADECGMSITGAASYRMEYRSTDSDYYTLQDSDWTYDLRTVSCRVVEGALAK